MDGDDDYANCGATMKQTQKLKKKKLDEKFKYRPGK